MLDKRQAFANYMFGGDLGEISKNPDQEDRNLENLGLWCTAWDAAISQTVDKHHIREMSKKINSIPSDGDWWHESSKEVFVQHGLLLMQRGLDIDAVMELLGNLYSAVAIEYGDS